MLLSKPKNLRSGENEALGEIVVTQSPYVDYVSNAGGHDGMKLLRNVPLPSVVREKNPIRVPADLT